MKYYAVVEYQAPGSMEPAEIQRAFFNNNRIRAVTSLDDANSMAQSVEDKAHLIFEIAFTKTKTISELKLLDGVTGARPFKSNDKEIKDAIYIKPAKASNDFILTKAMIKDAEIDLSKVETQRIADAANAQKIKADKVAVEQAVKKAEADKAAAEEAAKKAEADKIAAEEALKKAAADKATEEAARKVEADKAAEEAAKKVEADKAAEEAAKKAEADKAAADEEAFAKANLLEQQRRRLNELDAQVIKHIETIRTLETEKKELKENNRLLNNKKVELEKSLGDLKTKIKNKEDRKSTAASLIGTILVEEDKASSIKQRKLVFNLTAIAVISLAAFFSGFMPALLLKTGLEIAATQATLVILSAAVGLTLVGIYNVGKAAYTRFKSTSEERYKDAKNDLKDRISTYRKFISGTDSGMLVADRLKAEGKKLPKPIFDKQGKEQGNHSYTKIAYLRFQDKELASLAHFKMKKSIKNAKIRQNVIERAAKHVSKNAPK